MREEIFMDDEMEAFKANVDEWIKEVTGDISELNKLPEIVCENFENTEHNYQLIKELKEEISGLKREIMELKLLQFIAMKKETIKNKA